MAIEHFILNTFSNSMTMFCALILFIHGAINYAISTKSRIIVFFTYLFGLILHEFTHFITSFFLNGKPTNFNILPSYTTNKDVTYWNFGSVFHSNATWYNSVFIGFAPVSLFYVSYFIEKNFFLYFNYNLVNYLIYLFLMVITIINAIPSKQDFKFAFRSYYSTLFSLFIIITSLIIIKVFI